MASVNKVVLIGNLGRGPDVKRIDGGSIKVSFTLATNDYYKNKAGERVSKTEWHNVVLWGKLAELGEKYLVKGKQVYVEGRLQSRSFEGRDGEIKYVTEVVANSMILLGAGKGEGVFTDAESSLSSDLDDNY